MCKVILTEERYLELLKSKGHRERTSYNSKSLNNYDEWRRSLRRTCLYCGCMEHEGPCETYP